MGGGEQPQGYEGDGGGGVGAKSEGWSGDSGGSDATSDAGLEEDKEEHAPLTASIWGTQEIGARGLRVGARAGGSGDRKVTSGTADGGGRGAAMGRKMNTVGKREASGVRNVKTPAEWGETLGAMRPPEWTLIPT